ncbi:MAG TPA: sarcosine oxidase subunit gamma family protein [Burkholderiaceae bacterium]|nr:sarcosine oxidase subunit gamma family protein [Burkholderiaceae bacterium]
MSDRTALAEWPIAAAWNVQGDGTHVAFIDQVARQFSIALPIAPNTTARIDAVTAVWLGPRSWLLVAESAGSTLVNFPEKREALNAAGGALFDISASRVSFRLRGKGATDVLATGCPLDLHPNAFRSGQCRQSMFGHVNALLLKTDEVPTFVIMVARSFARGVWQNLEARLNNIE